VAKKVDLPRVNVITTLLVAQVLYDFFRENLLDMGHVVMKSTKRLDSHSRFGLLYIDYECLAHTQACSLASDYVGGTARFELEDHYLLRKPGFVPKEITLQYRVALEQEMTRSEGRRWNVLGVKPGMQFELERIY